MLKMIVLKLFQEYAFQQEPFGTMPNMMVLKHMRLDDKLLSTFGTMLNMIVSKPRNMLFIKIIVFHKMLKTLLYD